MSTELKRYLKEYRPPEFLIPEIDLTIDLYEEQSRVVSRFAFMASPEVQDAAKNGCSVPALILDGLDLFLAGLVMNGRKLSEEEFCCDEKQLVIFSPPLSGHLEITVEINPAKNQTHSGLYWKNGIFCTQNEPEGFRRITFFCDRPDVLSIYTVTVSGNLERYPFLLSNGNPREKGNLPDGRHFAVWHDPYPKPCYLFALVAGDFAVVKDSFVTRSGKLAALRIFVEKGSEKRTAFTMEAIKRAMRWDEETFELEYDLDIFMIAAVPSFNSGAMENKGLNIYNASLALADRETATDQQFQLIERVVGHEYFHNWTGNRITCRDWFQITLKEGLTIYRDEEFHIANNGGTAARITMANEIQRGQFPEDASPLAHPVRPDSYISISNFYTLTVYKKGKEIIRMIRSLIGTALFNEGIRYFLHQFDGQAVTVEDFVGSMEYVSGTDLSRMMDWYRQAGTPMCQVSGMYDPALLEFRIHIQQTSRPTAASPNPVPLLIPLRLGLLDNSGHDMKLSPAIAYDQTKQESTRYTLPADILLISDKEQEFIFRDVKERPVPSLLRGFSAPVKLVYPYSEDELIFLMQHDSDTWARYDAGQRFMLEAIQKAAQNWRAGSPIIFSPQVIDVLARLPKAESGDPALISKMLDVPGVEMVALGLPVFDTEAAQAARKVFLRLLAEAGQDALISCYAALQLDEYSASAKAIARRSLKNCCLGLLGELEGSYRELAFRQYDQADNLTDRLTALKVLAEKKDHHHIRAFENYYHRWRDNLVMINHWFALQAGCGGENVYKDVLVLEKDPAFNRTNPSAVNNLYGSFAANLAQFHRPDGKAYALIADLMMEHDEHNPQLAARLGKSFMHFPRILEPQRTLMSRQLERILLRKDISNDLYEVIDTILHNT